MIKLNALRVERFNPNLLKRQSDSERERQKEISSSAGSLPRCCSIAGCGLTHCSATLAPRDTIIDQKYRQANCRMGGAVPGPG